VCVCGGGGGGGGGISDLMFYTCDAEIECFCKKK